MKISINSSFCKVIDSLSSSTVAIVTFVLRGNVLRYQKAGVSTLTSEVEVTVLDDSESLEMFTIDIAQISGILEESEGPIYIETGANTTTVSIYQSTASIRLKKRIASFIEDEDEYVSSGYTLISNKVRELKSIVSMMVKLSKIVPEIGTVQYMVKDERLYCYNAIAYYVTKMELPDMSINEETLREILKVYSKGIKTSVAINISPKKLQLVSGCEMVTATISRVNLALISDLKAIENMYNNPRRYVLPNYESVKKIVSSGKCKDIMLTLRESGRLTITMYLANSNMLVQGGSDENAIANFRLNVGQLALITGLCGQTLDMEIEGGTLCCNNQLYLSGNSYKI